MELILGDCDRCGQQAECVQLVVKEFKDEPEHFPDYESSNVCASCIGNMLAFESQM